MAERVAAILVNTSEGRFLERTLAALREQTRPADRVIVVDNGSSDGSPAMIEARFPEVELMRLGCNAGAAAATNAGIASAAGCAWVARLDADARPEPGWLAALLDAARRRPEFSFFATRMLLAGRPGALDGTGDMYHVSGMAWRRDQQGVPAASAPHATVEAEVFGACSAAALYRRDDLLAVGGLDESFFVYLEDADLAFRLRLAGHRCLYVPAAVVHHVGSGTNGVDSDFTMYLNHRNMVWMWWKDMPAPLLALYLPQHVLANIWSVAPLVRAGRGRLMWRAKRDAVRGLPRVLRGRAAVQRGRTVSVWEVRRTMLKGPDATRFGPRIATTLARFNGSGRG